MASAASLAGGASLGLGMFVILVALLLACLLGLNTSPSPFLPSLAQPIGAGDVYKHTAPILNISIGPDNTTASVWTQPMQWACDNVPCDCLLEQRIALKGNAVEVELILHTARSDTTFYPGQTQELPAVYVVGDYCHLWTYNGTQPFAGDALAEQPAVWGANAWGAFTSGERWMAFTNASGWGLGVVSPFVAHFGAGFFNNGVIGTYNCTPKGYGPTDSPTGYIAPWGAEIIDPTTPFAYRFALVLGSLAEIRSYAASEHAEGNDMTLQPQLHFFSTGTREHSVYTDMQDGGLTRIGEEGGLQLNVTGQFPTLHSPLTVFSPARALRVVVNISYTSLPPGVANAALWFVALGEDTPCPTCLAAAAVGPADGTWRELAFDLAANPAYTALAAVTQVLFQPFGAAPLEPMHFAEGKACVASILSTQ